MEGGEKREEGDPPHKLILILGKPSRMVDEPASCSSSLVKYKYR